MLRKIENFKNIPNQHGQAVIGYAFAILFATVVFSAIFIDADTWHSIGSGILNGKTLIIKDSNVPEQSDDNIDTEHFNQSQPQHKPRIM